MVDGGGHRIGSARRLAAPAAAALAILLATSGAALALSGGAEIPVNTTTANSQTNPAIASGPDGGFTVAWQSFGQDEDLHGVYARRFDSSGTPLTGEIPVNSTTASNQQSPAVAFGPNGGFTVAWQDFGQDGDGYGVYVRRFDAAGLPLTDEIRVNTVIAGSQASPAISADPDGGFTVAWEGQDSDDAGVYARRFSAGGGPLTAEIPVNTTTTSFQLDPVIASAPDGGFAVAWESEGQDGDGYGIYARRFNAGGGPVGPEIPVNATTASHQEAPAIASGSAGGFTVTWESLEQDGESYGIYARRFDAAAGPLTAEIPVNTTTADLQGGPAVSPDPGGGFTVAWESFGQDGDGLGVYARRFDGDGSPLSAEIPVNTTTAGTQGGPAIAPHPDGGFTATWDSHGQDGALGGVYARRFVEPTSPPPPPQATDTTISLRILGKRLRVNRRGVGRLRLQCAATEKSPPCSGRVTVRTRAKLRLSKGSKGKRRKIVLASAGFRIDAGKTKAVSLRLKGRKLALLRGDQRARRVVATAGVRDAAGNRATVRKRLLATPKRTRQSQ